MGDPQHAYPVIHITGTNGKGSTAQMITRLLMAQGLQVGTYTSPHLERINERWARDAEPIADEELAEQIAAVADLEGLTGVRPELLRGVHGRRVPLVRRHRRRRRRRRGRPARALGRHERRHAPRSPSSRTSAWTTTSSPARRWPTSPARSPGSSSRPAAAVIGETDPAIVAVLAEAPAASRLLRGTDFETAGNTLAVGGRLVDIRTPTTIYPDVFVPLHGAHQGDNASLALTAVEAFFAAPLSEEVVTEGFSNVTMPGRFEVLGHQPLVVIDGAHNPAGADTCAQVFFDDFNPDGRRILVVGTLREPTAMLEALRADEFDVVVACTAPSPRGVPVADVARAAVALGCDEVLAADTVEAACALAMHGADGDDAVLAAGCLYVAGAARPALQRLLP